STSMRTLMEPRTSAYFSSATDHGAELEGKPMKHRMFIGLSLIALFSFAGIAPVFGQFNKALETGVDLKARSVLNTQDRVDGIAFARDGSSLWCAAGNRALRWDLQSREPGKILKYHSSAEYGNPDWHQNLVFCMAASPDGTTLATADQRGVVKIWDAAT